MIRNMNIIVNQIIKENKFYLYAKKIKFYILKILVLKGKKYKKYASFKIFLLIFVIYYKLYIKLNLNRFS